MQVMSTGIIPGNRNADNIDPDLAKMEYLLFLSQTIPIPMVRTALIKSFGFGQVGGEVLLVHPNYVFAALSSEEYEDYQEKRKSRHAKTYRHLHDMLIGVAPLIQVKNDPPYSPAMEKQVYLNPLARATFIQDQGSWQFTPCSIKASTEELLKEFDGKGSMGIDVQLIKEIPYSVDEDIEENAFIVKNFTREEIQLCQSRPDPRASFAGRWAAKEAIMKALYSSKHGSEHVDWMQGAGASLRGIEVLSDEKGAPVVSKVDIPGVYSFLSKNIQVSISHSGDYAIAIAKVHD